MPTHWTLVTPDPALLRALLPVARRIFTDTFAHLYARADFEAFCDGVYADDGPMSDDFRDPSVHWCVATGPDGPIGYAKLTPLRAPAIDPPAGALELQQIYVLAAWQGRGVAQQLMAWATSTAQALAASALYLTVFDHNQRAKCFYARHGFRDVGRCTFTLGTRVDEDRIWCRPMTAPAHAGVATTDREPD